ncbi:family 78 glycoside hydrolase catalytic domain [Lacihabitans lacunae]|uniref:alpha-L-rhamnosidase n=1 Tax=Lacihabitans lacunae TaxID=1028214 RepID=A0ABV7Z1V4_9BACT
MKKKILLGILMSLFIHPIFANFNLEKLQVNYLSKPLGTDNAKPQFSWQMKALDAKKGYLQTAYQIRVFDEANAEVWNSKKVTSGISNAVEYAGKALKASTKYTWQVQVWNNFGETSTSKSWFETGLLNPNLSAWSGANWIGGGDADLTFYSHYLAVYKISFGLQLDEKSGSTKAAFVFGANDHRLANQYLNLMTVEKGKNQSYVALEIDITNLKTGGSALLNIYRVGYTKTDTKETPIKSLEIPKSLINEANKYQKHQVYAESNLGVFEFHIDGQTDAHKVEDKSMEAIPPYGQPGFNVNPLGSGNNYITFPMLADIGFQTHAGQSANFSDIEITNFRFPGNTLFKDNISTNSALFSNLKIENGTYKLSGETLTTADPSKNAAPMLRTTFSTKNKKIKKARLYATARGIYEIYINGKRVGNDYFNPGLTQYNKHHMYQTYDVTNLIAANGKNAIGAWLSEGWWSGNITYLGDNWNYFGDRQSLLAKMVLTYEDGTEQVIASNDKDWKLYTDGPIRVGSFFQGEVYDANKEAAIKDWLTAAYNDKNWKNAEVVTLKGSTFSGENQLNFDDMKLIGQYEESPTIVKTLVAKKVENPRPGVMVYDMGQNMVGVPQIHIKNGKKGQLINMRFAEVLYPNLPEYKGNEGMVMMENIRAAHATDQYILKGGDETIQPRFTFHGYRFVEITGIETPIPVNEVKGLVISSVKALSSAYETNNPMVNKLWENITWSLRSNFLSIPTDCPQRNERMGWSGDISVFSKAATYLTDANQFFRKHLLAMRDLQTEGGRFTDVAPVGGGFGGTLWGSAGVVVAWESYSQYGDKQLLAEHYDAMKKYMTHLDSKINKDGILNEGPLGDWLSPEGNKNDNTLFWMAYFAYDLDIMSKMATALGKTEDAAAFLKRSEEIKKAFNDIYVDKNTHRTVKSGLVTGFQGPPGENQIVQPTHKGALMDTQASYAIPLALGAFDETNKPFAIQYLSETIARKNKDDGNIERPENSLMTGFIGTASISEALSQNGKEALSYKLLTNTQYPSWLYSVVNGATSIWERLNSYTVENGFGGNNSMNSFNHYSFGSVAAWMNNHSLGIQRGADNNAFKSFILQPTPDPNKEITFAKGYFDSMYGRISSSWKLENGTYVYEISVPANSTATLYLAAKSIDQITESGTKITNWKGVSQAGENVVIPLVSGNYKFSVK